MSAIVQKKFAYVRTGTAPWTVNLTSNPTTGNTLILMVGGSWNPAFHPAVPTNPGGWTLLSSKNVTGAEACGVIVASRSVQSGDGTTLTFAGTTAFNDDAFVAVWEVLGQPDITGVANSSPTGSPAETTSFTPPNDSQAFSLVMFIEGGSITFSGISPAPPYSLEFTQIGLSPVSGAVLDAAGAGIPSGIVSALNSGSGAGGPVFAYATGVSPSPPGLISLSVQPGFFDLEDSTISCGQPFADYDLIKISYDAKLGVCRPEAFFMGYFTDGATLPLPVSPLDTYAYDVTESLYFFQLASTKPPLPGFTNGQETFPSLDFDGNPVEGFLCDPYELEPNFGTLTQAGFSTGKQLDLKCLMYEHGSVGNNVPQQPYSAGSIAAYCFGQRQSAPMNPILPGPVYQTNYQPVFYDLPDSAIYTGAPITQTMLQAMSRNAKLGVFRFEIFFMGYYRNGDVVPTPYGAGNYHYSYDECIFMPLLASSRQPTGDFVPGQVYFPQLANLDIFVWPPFSLPEQLYIDPASGQVTVTLRGGTGTYGSWLPGSVAAQGSVAVYCLAQRYPNLTMAAQPTFSDIPDSSFVGGQVPTAALLQQLNNNAKFGIVATEAFFLGYYQNGNTPSLPTSPVDGYAYQNHETLFIPVWVSSRGASGLIPGQKTFPALAGYDWSPSDNTTIVASPYECYVNQFKSPYGKLTSALYAGGSGVSNQGIVAMYAICSRQQNITGTTL